jgi:FkbM family methyltransferase
MLVQKASAAIKSVPFLYHALRPVKACMTAGGRAEQRLRRYCRSIPTLVPRPVFVKVGANDGLSGDVVSDILLANEEWRGLLIEPVPYVFDRLRANFHDARRFSLEQVAIGASAGQAAFYYVDAKAMASLPDLPGWYDQLGSFDKLHITKHLDGALTPFIVESTVEVLPMAEVLKRNEIRDAHLLHIDTEGYDYEILKTVDLTQDAPWAILVEHRHLPGPQKAEMLVLLRNHGYFVDDCGTDYFAIHKRTLLSKLAKDLA